MSGSVASDTGTPSHAATEDPPPTVGSEPTVVASRSWGRRLRSQIPWFLGRVGVLVVFVLLWQLAVTLDESLERFVSTPAAVGRALAEQVPTAKLWTNLGHTLRAMVLGFAVGTLLGGVVGFVMALSRTLDRLLDPWVAILNALPRIALAPLFILWFGITMQAKIALAVSIVFFVQLVATRSGIKNIDSDLLLVTRLAGMSRVAVVRKVVLPGSIPAVFAGLRLSLVYSLLGVVTSEMIASRNGIGQLLVVETQLFRVHNVFAYLAVLSAIAAILNEAFGALERWILRWQGTQS